MNGFIRQESAALEAIEEATIVMDPFHVVAVAVAVAVAEDKLDECRQRLRQETLGHCRETDCPLYGVSRTAKTRANLLTKKQWSRLLKVFGQPASAACNCHLERLPRHHRRIPS